MIRITSNVNLKSLSKGQGFLFGTFPDDFCYAILKEKRWKGGPGTKCLITVIDPLVHTVLNKKRDYAIDITKDVLVIPVTKKPFSKVLLDDYFISILGVICKRIELSSGEVHCFYSAPGENNHHLFKDSYNVYVPDKDCVRVLAE